MISVGLPFRIRFSNQSIYLSSCACACLRIISLGTLLSLKMRLVDLVSQWMSPTAIITQIQTYSGCCCFIGFLLRILNSSAAYENHFPSVSLPFLSCIFVTETFWVLVYTTTSFTIQRMVRESVKCTQIVARVTLSQSFQLITTVLSASKGWLLTQSTML